ncbi:tetratricopeptide repeat protein [Ekhidna sp.]
MSESLRKFLIGLFISCLILMLWSYHTGYDNAIDWEVTTTGEVIEFPAWSLPTDLMTHEIKGEKYLLSERYSGSEIKRSIQVDKALLILMWVGLCVTLAASTYLKRYAFFVVVALFALFLNRLNLYEIGIFGIESKLVILLPFILLISPLVIFHEYKKTTSFFIRFVSLVFLSVILFLGIGNVTLFTDHFIAHSLFGFTICGLIFLFIISEELVFGILYVITAGKGGKSNHIHFLILSLIYLGNLALYYLNKSGLYENSFFFFDPFILFFISCIVSLWSLKFKISFLSKYVHSYTAQLLIYSLGIITFCFLTHNLIRGNDAVYQAFHYFILYFHLGFGALFFLYIIGNFIDPLIKGFEVHKIAFKERNFPYVSARLGGFFAVLAFYFLAGQEPYNLLKSGYYNYLAQEAKTEGNLLLAKEYTLQASYLGYNTHMANYNLGWDEKKKQADYPSKTYFHSAAQRFPSTYAWVNYGNLDAEINPNKVQAIYEEALRSRSSGEMENNLGVLHLHKGELDKSLSYLEGATPSDSWNDAPLINKWNVLKKLEVVDSSSIEIDFQLGNFGVKANTLTTQTRNHNLEFQFEGVDEARQLHRHAYLLNSLYLFSHDSVESLTRGEVEKSSDGTFNNRLRKALAIHLYDKGEVNESFMMLDYLQANAHQYYKGQYLDALGKLAMDQQSYRLALEFFNKAIELRNTESIFSRLEVLARLGRKDEIPNELLRILKKNPEFTQKSNGFLTNLQTFNPSSKKRISLSLDSLSDEQLIEVGRLNAFHEDQVILVVNELKKRESSGGYELLVDALEINPYGIKILKKYILKALDWNLISYADQALGRLKELLSENEYSNFEQQYVQLKEEIEQSDWE